MPKRAARVCSVPGCANLVDGGSRCGEHLQTQRRQHDATRPTSAQRGYDANWRRIREEFLEENPLCADCGQPAVEVHHKVALANGGTNDKSNLLQLCKSDHSRRTALEIYLTPQVVSWLPPIDKSIDGVAKNLGVNDR